MSVKQTANPAKSEIQKTRNAIRRSWSTRERHKRGRIAEVRQHWIFSVLLPQQAAAPVRVV